MFKTGDKVVYYKYDPKNIGIKLYEEYTIDFIAHKWLYLYYYDRIPTSIGPYDQCHFISSEEYRKLKLEKICSKLGTR